MAEPLPALSGKRMISSASARHAPDVEHHEPAMPADADGSSRLLSHPWALSDRYSHAAAERPGHDRTEHRPLPHIRGPSASHLNDKGRVHSPKNVPMAPPPLYERCALGVTIIIQ